MKICGFPARRESDLINRDLVLIEQYFIWTVEMFRSVAVVASLIAASSMAFASSGDRYALFSASPSEIYRHLIFPARNPSLIPHQMEHNREGSEKYRSDGAPDFVSHLSSIAKQTFVDAPNGKDPVALYLGSMVKGHAWVYGHNIGRYWSLVSPREGGQKTCDYRGAYNYDKCTTNCGKPTQN